MNDRIADLYRRLDELTSQVESLAADAASNPVEVQACFDERDEDEFRQVVLPGLTFALTSAKARILGAVTVDVAKRLG